MLGARTIETPGDMPNLYGDGAWPKVPLTSCRPTRGSSATLLLDAHKDGRWTPGGWNPLPANVKYDVLRDILSC